MNRFPLPGDDRLEALIRESFDAMPGPDMRRLEQLESRLVRTALQNKRNRVNTLPWWIVLIISGGFAMASWWVADRIYDDSSDVTTVTEIPELNTTVQETDIENNEPGSATSDPVQPENQKSPVIYTRENF